MGKPSPIEQALVAYLSPVVDDLGAYVSTRLRADRPGVRVSRVGGSAQNVGLSQVRVLVECFADEQGVAWSLASACWGAVRASVDFDEIYPGVEITAVNELGEPVNFPDVETGSARYQFWATLTTTIKE